MACVCRRQAHIEQQCESSFSLQQQQQGPRQDPGQHLPRTDLGGLDILKRCKQLLRHCLAHQRLVQVGPWWQLRECDVPEVVCVFAVGGRGVELALEPAVEGAAVYGRQFK